MEKKNNNWNMAAYIAGEMDKKNRAEMDNEIQKDTKMQEEIDDYSKLWSDSEQLSKYDKIDVEGDWKSVRKRMDFSQKSKKIPFTKYMLRISAILVLAFGLVYLLNSVIKQIPTKVDNDYFKVVAQEDIKLLSLPDGSVVTLNKDAEIFYNNNFGTDNRDVILDGEAFFEVARNESLPFKVFVSNSTVEVLGTSFNVKSFKEDVQLSVVTCHVAFFETTDKENRVELVENEMVEYNSAKQRFEEKTNLNPNILSWKTKTLEFKTVPMEEVFSTVAEFYGLDLTLKMSKGFSESVTGSFNNQSLEEVLDIISMSTKQDFKFSITDKKLVISD